MAVIEQRLLLDKKTINKPIVFMTQVILASNLLYMENSCIFLDQHFCISQRLFFLMNGYNIFSDYTYNIYIYKILNGVWEHVSNGNS